MRSEQWNDFGMRIAEFGVWNEKQAKVKVEVKGTAGEKY